MSGRVEADCIPSAIRDESVDRMFAGNYSVITIASGIRVVKVKLVPIGNSRGVRIPQAFIKACGFGEHVDMRVEQSAIVLSAPSPARDNWDSAFAKMADAGDDAPLLPDDMSREWDDAQWEW